jgi:hypothetical protein
MATPDARPPARRTCSAAENSLLSSALSDLVSGMGVQKPKTMAEMKAEQQRGR